jgi:hypothetical protein
MLTGVMASKRRPASARIRPIRDADGKARGFSIETADGRQAAVVRPDPVRLKVSLSGKEPADGS